MVVLRGQCGAEFRAELPESIEELRDIVRGFAEREMRSDATAGGQAFVRQTLMRLGKAGLLGLRLPEIHGGTGFGHVGSTVMIEELARLSADVAVAAGLHAAVGAASIAIFGTEDQKKAYLAELVDGQKLMTVVVPQDEDVPELAATPCGDGYLLRGSARHVLNAAQSNLFIVVAALDGKVETPVALVIQRSAGGVDIGPDQSTLGLNGIPINEVRFANVHCRTVDCLGGESAGATVRFYILSATRLVFAATAVGLLQGALIDAANYAMARQQFGRRLSEFQAIQMKLADMEGKVRGSRLLAWKAAAFADAGLDFLREASQAKLAATDAAASGMLEAVQIFGGYGYLEDYPQARRMRDAKTCQLLGGNRSALYAFLARGFSGGAS